MAWPASADLPRTYTFSPIDNPTPDLNERFGDGLVNGGDVDGDGEDDILVGIDEHGTVSGEVSVFSGATGALLHRIPPPDPDAGGAGDNPDAFGTFVGKIADLGSCPNAGTRGDDPGENCTATQTDMDTGDSVPDHLASAIGVDVVQADGDDMGMIYVLDGATGTVLKRLRMPPGDRAEQAANSPTASQGPGFGRTVLSASGQPPCAGFAGIDAACAYTTTSFVARGDLDGGGKPDIGVGASDFTDAGGGAGASDNPTCTTTCFQTGRYYVFRGEDLTGLAPSQPLEDSYYTVKNLLAQNDDPTVNSRFHREAMGYSVAPVGDLGKCNNATPIADTDDPSSYRCLNTANTITPDGKPEFILSVHRYDSNGLGDVGAALAIDGPTGRVLDVYNHPEPQQSAVFAFSNYNQPALGDAASTTAPDVYQGAMIQAPAEFTAQGRGYVLSGDFRNGGANHYRIATIDDPTPGKIGNFGTSSAGIGNVFGDGRKELAVGAYGPHAPQVVEDTVSDVHIFSPLHDQLLQTISDPANQPGGGFGRSVAPIGDVNDDGFLDFAVGAGGYDPGDPVVCSPCNPGTSNPAQGRIWRVISDNSPAPVAPQPGPGGGGGAGAQSVLAGRTVDLAAEKARIRRGRRVRLSGVIEAFANDSACEPGQSVQLQRRRPGRAGFRTFATRTTNGRGGFATRIRPRQTFVYRARVLQTSQCLGAASDKERVSVVRRRR